MVDSKGYIYYAERQYSLFSGEGLYWYWDDNEYDLLVEMTVEKIEILELKFGDVVYNVTRNFEDVPVKGTYRHACPIELILGLILVVVGILGI